MSVIVDTYLTINTFLGFRSYSLIESDNIINLWKTVGTKKQEYWNLQLHNTSFKKERTQSPAVDLSTILKSSTEATHWLNYV